MADWSENFFNLLLEQLKTLYLNYHNAYGLQIWQVLTYIEELPPLKSHDPLITVVLPDHMSN